MYATEHLCKCFIGQLSLTVKREGKKIKAKPAVGYSPHKAVVVSTDSCSIPAVYYVIFIKIAQKVVCRYLTLI